MGFSWIDHLRSKIFKPKPAFSQMDTGGDQNHNPLMVQFFEWTSLPPPGVSWWKHFENEVPKLASLGCTQVWLPPPNKAMALEGEGHGRGYDAYDFKDTHSHLATPSWDLGEFNQKGTVATRWGTKAELLHAVQIAKQHGIGILIDAVLNHKLGADRTERFQAVEVDPENRLLNLGEPREIEGWTAFDFPGRGDKYSKFRWTHHHFTGLDWDQQTKKKGIYKITSKGHKGWSNRVDDELGNYDFLLGTDIEFRHPDVEKDFMDWASWILQETGASGFRLDACKHIDRRFLRRFVNTARKQHGYERAFIVAEYWSASVEKVEQYIRQLNAPVSMFDVPLHDSFHRASQLGPAFDLRQILDGSLVQRRPLDAVTFVDNHDTAIGCSLESWVGENFKLVAYALILLRPDGHPCVYHADLYGPGLIPQLPNLMTARKDHAFGGVTDYFDDEHCIAFVRGGNDSHPNGCVVLCSNGVGDAHSKDILVGTKHAGSTWVDLLGSNKDVQIGQDGRASFRCPPSGVAVYVKAP